MDQTRKPRGGQVDSRPYEIPFEDWMSEERSGERPCYGKTYFFSDERETEHGVPVKPLEVRKAEVQAARTLCGQCQHQARCLEIAMECIWAPGIWGGTTHRERKCAKGVCKHPEHKMRAAA